MMFFLGWGKLNCICGCIKVMLHCGIWSCLRCTYEVDSVKIKGYSLIHFAKWSTLQNGSGDSPKG